MLKLLESLQSMLLDIRLLKQVIHVTADAALASEICRALAASLAVKPAPP
jgi:hypothetical protein